MPAAACSSRWSSRAVCRATRRTGSSGAARCARPTSAAPCATCSPSIRSSRSGSASTSSTRASTTRRSCATSRRSWPGSTRSSRLRLLPRPRQPDAGSHMSVADTFIRAGKVRDLYAVSADRLLLVASDRISAFDVVLPTPIPDKGKVLTGLSRFWFDETSGLVANHLLSTDLDDVDPIYRPRSGSDGRRVEADDLRGRVMLCRRVDVLPVEVIVRGYLAG